MDTLSLGNQILEIIEEETCCEYIGKLEVIVDEDNISCWESCDKRDLGPTTYTLNLYLNMSYSPMVFMYQGTEDEFKDFIREEIKKRRLEDVLRYKVTRLPLEYEEKYEESERNW